MARLSKCQRITFSDPIFGPSNFTATSFIDAVNATPSSIGRRVVTPLVTLENANTGANIIGFGRFLALNQPFLPKLGHYPADDGILGIAKCSRPVEQIIQGQSISQSALRKMDSPKVFERIPLFKEPPSGSLGDKVGHIAAWSHKFLGQRVGRAANHATQDRLVIERVAVRKQQFRPSLSGKPSDEVVHRGQGANESHIYIGKRDRATI